MHFSSERAESRGDRMEGPISHFKRSTCPLLKSSESRGRYGPLTLYGLFVIPEPKRRGEGVVETGRQTAVVQQFGPASPSPNLPHPLIYTSPPPPPTSKPPLPLPRFSLSVCLSFCMSLPAVYFSLSSALGVKNFNRRGSHGHHGSKRREVAQPPQWGTAD